MKTWRIALVLSLLAGMVPAGYAFATAQWTYKSKRVQTVTGQYGISCEYEYAGPSGIHRFWKTFTGDTCPATVEVE